MRILLFCLAACAASAPAFTQTSAPAAPSVTAGAEFKGLRLDWDPVAGASWYQLEYRAHQNAAFVQQGDDYPTSKTVATFRLPLHLFDWTYARYRVAACNSAGCTRSPEVSVSTLRRFAVGYFKPAQTLVGQRFGADTDISSDGLNFVSAAPGDFITSGGTTHAGGTIYVFRRNSSGTWLQRARLEPTVPPFIEGLNEMYVAISGDGNTVALGMPNYWHEEHDARGGEVFVFHFNGTSWVRTRLPAIARGAFGRWVALNEAGDTLAVARGESLDPPVPRRVDMYKLVNGSWSPVRSIGDKLEDNENCARGVLSRDGSTVAEPCRQGPVGMSAVRTYLRVHFGPNWTTRANRELQLDQNGPYGYGIGGIGIDGTGDTIAAQIYLNPGPNFMDEGPSEVHVFKRNGAVYMPPETVFPGGWKPNELQSYFGSSIAMSADGSTLAVGDPADIGLGTGPRAVPLNPGTATTGGVYIYRFTNFWRPVSVVKPNYHPNEGRTFGVELALSGNGQTLIIGESLESSGAEGIGGDWNNTAVAQSGAVWMY